MQYRLDELVEWCQALEVPFDRVDENHLRVEAIPNGFLSFMNLPDGDTLCGFDEGPNHFHGEGKFMTGPDTYVVMDELEVLAAVADGTLVVVSEYREGALADRWLIHRDEGLELKYLESGERLVVEGRGKPNGNR